MTTLNELIDVAQTRMDRCEGYLKENPNHEEVKCDFEFLKEVFVQLEQLTQYKARFEELNKGFVDIETGKRIPDCTPYAMERLKWNMHLVSKEAMAYKDLLDKIKSSFPFNEWDNSALDPHTVCGFIGGWIEENNVRPRTPNKNENFA